MSNKKFIKYKGKLIGINGKFLSTKLEKSILGTYYYPSNINVIISNTFNIDDGSTDFYENLDSDIFEFSNFYSGGINDYALDGKYLYVGGSGTNAIRRFNLDDPEETPITFSTYGGTINSLVIHDGYIYAGGVTTNAIRRWDLNNIESSEEGHDFEFSSYGGTINSLFIYNDYIYEAGSDNEEGVRRWDLNDLTKEEENIGGFVSGQQINKIYIHNDLLYLAHNISTSIRRLDLNDLETPPIVSQPFGASSFGQINNILIKDNYIYVSRRPNFGLAVIGRLPLNDFESSTELSGAFYTGILINDMFIKDDSLYGCGSSYVGKWDLIDFGKNITENSIWFNNNTRFSFEYNNDFYVISDNRINKSIGKLFTGPQKIFSSYENTVNTLVKDNNYIYAGGFANIIRRWDLNNPGNDYEQFGSFYGGTINSLVIHDGYIYAGGATTNAIRKWDLNDINDSHIQFSTYGGLINSLVIHDGYIYAGGGTTNAIRKWSLSDSTTHTQFSPYGGPIRSLVIHDGYIYAGGVTTNAIRRWDLFNPTGETLTFDTYGGTINSLVIHDGYIYAGGQLSYIRRYNLNGTFDKQYNTPDFPSHMYVKNNYIYYTGGTTRQFIRRIDIENSIEENSYYNNALAVGTTIRLPFLLVD